MKKVFFCLVIFLAAIQPKLSAQTSPKYPIASWGIEKTGADLLWAYPVKKIIKIAIVDDAFLTTHESIAPYLWTNTKEVPGNRIDDDGNGYIDDVHGFDVSDNDGNVNPMAQRGAEFFHGTHIASTVAFIANGYNKSGARVELMLVKCLADQAQTMQLRDGYKGIEYALAAGADVICCSWGGLMMNIDQLELVEKALRRGVYVVASTGNGSMENFQFPAAIPGVIATMATNRADLKLANQTFGAYVQMSAPGEDIRAASALSDTSYVSYSGSSMAVPFVGAILGRLMANFPEVPKHQWEWYLKNGAAPIDAINTRFTGKLGAGRIDVANIMAMYPFEKRVATDERLVNARGFAVKAPKSKDMTWRIHPAHPQRGVRLTFNHFDFEGKLDIYRASDLTTAFQSIEMKKGKKPDSLYIPFDQMVLKAKGKNLQGKTIAIGYETIPVDSSKLYCSEQKLAELPQGFIEDGSGEENYAGNQACKWLIRAPAGQRIRVRFEQLDTEPKIDFVYLFDGNGTHERIIAMFSGNELPPEVTSLGNQVLVWFVTDDIRHGKGWKLYYDFFPVGSK